MIDPRYTDRLYEALCWLMEMINYNDILEVGGEPLQHAFEDADALIKEIEEGL